MPISGTAPLLITFTSTASSDVTAWAWTFGDGNTSTSASPTNTYTTAGTYTVTLTVTGTCGKAVISDTVTVGSTVVAYSNPSPSQVASVGYDPQVMLRVSNDGGKTWIMEQWCSAGQQGEYSRRVKWNRLGCAKRRVFEVSVTDPAPWKLTGAYITVSK